MKLCTYLAHNKLKHNHLYKIRFWTPDDGYVVKILKFSSIRTNRLNHPKGQLVNYRLQVFTENKDQYLINPAIDEMVEDDQKIIRLELL